MRYTMATMMEVSTVLRSLALIVALLAAGIPTSAQMHAPLTSGDVRHPRPTRLERPRELPNDSADEYDHYVFLPLIHGPSPYPLHPPQIEPGVGEYSSHWLLLDYDIEYGVWEGDPLYRYVEPGDPVIEVTVRVMNDSDVDYWTWVTGTSYDAEGNFLTGTIWVHPPPFENMRFVHGHEAGDFTFHMKSHRAIELIRLDVFWSVIPPP